MEYGTDTRSTAKHSGRNRSIQGNLHVKRGCRRRRRLTAVLLMTFSHFPRLLQVPCMENALPLAGHGRSRPKPAVNPPLHRRTPN